MRVEWEEREGKREEEKNRDKEGREDDEVMEILVMSIANLSQQIK